MSLLTVTSHFLTIRPKVWTEGDVLCVRSAFIGRVFSLFSYCRDMRVDPSRRVVEVTRRRLWAFEKDWTIPFDRIDYIDREFRSTGTSWGWTADGYGRHDQVERFVAVLVLKDPPETVRLFSFFGEGAVATGWFGVFWGEDDLIDFSGDQEESFRNFLDVLKQYTGATIGKAVPHFADAHGAKRWCTECGRPAPPRRSKCLYCGGRIEARQSEEQ